MIEKIVETTIDRQRLIECGQNIGIGVSGGADSMVLLEVLYRLQQRRSCSFRLFVLHFEHGIRGEESVADMQFVRQYCAERGIPCIFEQRDVPAYAAQHGLNLEDAARRLRYDFFARCRRQHGLEAVAVAHHMDDLAETFLLHLIRGSGSEGLSALPYRRSGGIIRPMLDVTRAQIEEYANAQGIPYRQDSTNADLSNSRNYIRAELLPRMRKLNPEANNAIMRAGRIIAEEQQLLQRYTLQEYGAVAKESEGRVSLRISDLQLLEPAMLRRVLRTAIARCAGTLQDIDSTVIGRLEELVQRGETGRVFAVPDVFFAQTSYDLLIIDAKMYTINKIGQVSVSEGVADLPNGGSFCIRPAEYPSMLPQKEALCQYIDAEKLPGGCVVRTREAGDVFRPLGMQGSQKLKDWFIDHKIPREQREQQLLLCCGQEVLWIIGCALSEQLRLDPHTRQVYAIQYIMP